jgi:hypothetical protein
MVILRAELNYSRNVKRRNARKTLRKLRAKFRSGNALSWNRTGHAGRGVTDQPIGRLGLIRAVAFVGFLSGWRDSLAISPGAV